MSNRDSIERFMLITRTPIDGAIIPPTRLLEFYEGYGHDRRIPKRAVGRLASTHYRRAMEAKWRDQINSDGWVHSLGRPSEVETWVKPAGYPSYWGLSRIPRADELPWATWHVDYTRTWAYTSLNIPRPFDPQATDTSASAAVGFGYLYRDGSAWMDKYDIITRRGGGNRGGFAMTTGPTEGNYPTSVLATPTFNLGRLGYTNGGWNPEGIQYSNRPRRMRLTGLRNGWAHKAFFARSRQVMHRNVYGQVSTSIATPRAPTVVVNGMENLNGVVGITCRRELNTPTELSIEINNPRGKRSGSFKQFDTVQVYCSPRSAANPPLIFTGFISAISESDSITLTCLDTLGYLSLEPVLTQPNYIRVDAAQVIRQLVGESSYPIPVGRMLSKSRVTFPADVDLTGKTLLAALQTVLDYINNSPREITIGCDQHGQVTLTTMEDPESVSNPHIGGRSDLPLNGVVNLGKTRDFWPSSIVLSSGSFEAFNVATVKNSDLAITATFPTSGSIEYPASPVHRVFDDSAATTTEIAEFLAEQHVTQQGRGGERYEIQGRPERFDIAPGDAMVFYAFEGSGITGKQRIYSVGWTWMPRRVDMSLTVGRPAPSLIGSLRFAMGVTL